MIGDSHIGMGYPNSVDKWTKVHEEYFKDFLIPLLKREVKPGDIIVHVGDLFDNRNTIPINLLNYAQRLLEEISQIAPIHLIVGNHDMWHKSSSEINSVNIYKYMPNIFIYEKPKKLIYNNLNLLFVPYIEKKSEMKKILKENTDCNYVFCHSDLNGGIMHLNSAGHKNTDKIDVEEFNNYKKVFSGHYHRVQSHKNFTFVGSIFEMDRNDMDNQKGIFVLDTNNGNEIFFANNISPKFKKVYLMSELDIEKLENISSKDWIDLYISNSILIGNRKLRRKLEIMLESGNFASVEYVDDLKLEESKNESLNDKQPIEEKVVSLNLEYDNIIREYIVEQKWENEKIRNGVLTEFNEVIKIYKDTEQPEKY